MAKDLFDEFGVSPNGGAGGGDLFDEFKVAPPPEPEQDGALTRGAKNAWNSIQSGYSLLTGDTESLAKLTAERDAYRKANPGTPEGNELMQAWERGDGVLGGAKEVVGEMTKDWQEAPNTAGALRATGKNLSAMGGGIVEQIPNMVAPMAGMLVGGAAGAASPVPGGMLLGGWAGATAGNTAVESGEQIDRALMQAGINPQDTAAVKDFMAKNGDAILGKAATKGAIIGAVDTATMGLSHLLLSAPGKAAVERAIAAGINPTDEIAIKAAVKADPIFQASQKGLNSLARNGAVAALEPAGEFTGEYIGQGVATGDWDTKGAALEALSALGQGAITFAGQKAYEAATDPFRGAAAEPTPAATPEELDASAARLAGELTAYESLPGDVPQLGFDQASSVITVPNQDGLGETVIDRNAGPISAAVVDTGITSDMLANQTMLVPFASRDAAQRALDQREDADRLQIIPHPRVAGRFAIAQRDRLSLQAMDEATARQQQLEMEDGNAPPVAAQGSQGSGSLGGGSTGDAPAGPGIDAGVRPAADASAPGGATATSVGGGRANADPLTVQKRADSYYAAANRILDEGGDWQEAEALFGMADQLQNQVYALQGQDSQAELAPQPAQPVSEMPGVRAQNDERLARARAEAEARGATLIDEEASAAHPTPSDAQIAAGNYKKGHVKIGPLDVSIENPIGTTRKGPGWQTTMSAHYGYVKRTKGADGDQVDVFIREGTANDFNGQVYVVDQFDPKTGRFDEHKAMVGYGSAAEATQAYDQHFGDGSGPKRRRAVVTMPLASFNNWARNGDTSQALSQAGKAADAAQAEIEQATGKLSRRRDGETADQYQARMADEANARKRRAPNPVAAEADAADQLREVMGDTAQVVTEGAGLSRPAAKNLEQLGRIFGKKVVFFQTERSEEGFFLRGNTVFVNAGNTGIAQLRILGHEMLHALKADAPQIYRQMLASVEALLTDAEIRAQHLDYFGTELTGEISDETREQVAEEWMADLSGNRFGESSFWESVFAKLEEQHGTTAAKGIINRLRLAVVSAINKLMSAIRGGKFSVDARLAEHLDQIREALAKGFADYAKAVKDGKVEKAEGTEVKFSKAADHKMQITREERELADKTKMSRGELALVAQSAKQFGLPAKTVEMEVRRIKARFPESAGWAPLEFLRVDPNTMAKKANEKNPLSSDAIFFVQQPYKFHLDANGQDNKVSRNKRVKDVASALAGEIAGKYMAAQQGDPVAKVIMRQSDWYQALRGKLRATFGGFGDFLAQLLGPTSANNPVEPNFKYAVEALKMATSGKWDNLFKEVFAWKADIDAAAANLDRVIEEVRAEGGRGVMKDPRVLAAISTLKQASKYKGTLPRRENGKMFGMASEQIVQILADRWGDKVAGDAPKTKNYYQNIMGRTFDATIDVWAARTLRRLANDVVGNFPRIPTVAEGAVSGSVLADNKTSGAEFGFGQDVFKQAAEDLKSMGIDQFKNVTPDAVQAMVWFIEKETWATRNWTTKVGEEGSIEHEMLMAGYPDRDQLDAWRVAARAGKPNPETKGYLRKNGEFNQAKYERDVARWQEAKEIAAAELAKIEKYPDRFVAGVTTEIPNDKPTDAEMGSVAREIEAAAQGDKVMALRAQTSTGEFMGDFERTLDVELVARNGYDAVPLWNKLVEIGEREGQQAVFLSRVLREDEVADPLTHRPGVELYFAKPISLEQAQPLMDLINEAGVHGMTMVTEGRRTPSAMAGEGQPITGIRMQHIPEFMLGFGYSVSMANTEISASVLESRFKMDNLVRELMKRTDVSTVASHWYETKVHFYGEQNAEGTPRGAGRSADQRAWSGRSISEGLSSADRFARDGAAPLAARRAELEKERQLSRGGPRLSNRRAEQAPGTGNASSTGSLRAPSYGTSQAGSVTVLGIHYSKAERSSLAGFYYGQGMKGAEKSRLFMESASPEQRRRVHYYVDEGSGIRPESDVGDHAHATELQNVYDWNDDPLNLWAEARDKYKDPNDRVNFVEAEIARRGFDGVYASKAQGNQGVVVLLGSKHTGVPVQYLGTGYRGGEFKPQPTAAPAPKNTDADKVEQSRVLPAGQMSGADWKRMLPAVVPGIDASMLDDAKTYYKSDVVQAMRGGARLSRARAQTETPEFKKWFGKDSNLRNEDGSPMVLYHGTNKDFAVFKASKTGVTGAGVYLGIDPGTGESYAGDETGANVMPVYARGRYIGLDAWSQYVQKEGSWAKARAKAEADGVAGIIDVKIENAVNVFDPANIKSAIGNNGQFDGANPDIRFSPARQPIFYSQLARQIEQAPDRIFTTAPQVKLWLNGNAAKLGIKKDEIQWSGINEWLDMQGKGKVAKQQVLDYLDQGGVKVEEVEKAQEGYSEEEPSLPKGSGLSTDEDERGNWGVLDRNGRVIGRGRSEEDAIADAYSAYPDYWEQSGSTKYSDYTLPGGENYKELLLTLPSGRSVSEIEREWNDLPVTDPRWQALADERQRALGQGAFRSNHWEEKNILAHVRFNERTDAKGNRVLFIEEVQSDWGQAGKKQGFNTGERPAKAAFDAFIAKLRSDYEADIRSEFGAEVKDPARLERVIAPHLANPDHTKASYLERKSEYNALRRAYEDEQMDTRPKPGPFVTDTKAWVALALKRMMRYAADNGFQKIAFVNGEQSADRYDLSKQITTLYAGMATDGKYLIGADGKGGRDIIDQKVTKEELPGVVGKELAEKIIQDVTDEGTNAEYTGLDLKVGGEGMKTFYDKIVPQVASDLLKKMGGKLETVDLGSKKKLPWVVRSFLPDEERGDLAAVIGRYATKAEADAMVRQYGDDVYEVVKAPGKEGMSQQPGFAVPAAASEPMPLFSLRRRVDTALANVDHAVDGLSNLPSQFDYLTDRYLALGKIARVDEIVKEIRQAFSSKDERNKKAVYDYLTTRGANPSMIPDAEIRAMAERIKNTINYVGDQLVARGLIDQQARDHYRDQYLPRMYLRHMLDDDAAKVMGMGKKPSDLGYVKHRKDIPQEIRELVLGEVKDPAFLSANAIGRAMRDVALLDWMGKISLNNDWVFPEIFVTWKGKRVTAYWLKAEADRISRQSVHYDATNKPLAEQMVAQMRALADQTLGQMAAIDHQKYKQIPDTMRYGLLRGMWVRQEIFDDIMGAGQIMNADPTWFEDWFGVGGKGTKLTQWWKFTKVALNPPGQIRNFISNMVMLQLSGVGLHRLPLLLVRAAREISSNGRYWQVAKKYGVTESTFTAQELHRVRSDLVELEAQQGKLSSLRWLMTAGARFLEKVSDLYQFSEALGKTIKIMDEMDKGKSEAEAAIEAQKWLFDYSLVPRSVRIARNAPLGMPFITYQIKVLPRLLEVAAKHPWRFLPWMGLLYGMQAAVAAMFGVDDDELEKLKKSLPQWLQDRGHTVFLPMRDKDGRIQVADVGYFFPWTFYSTAGKHAAEGNMKKLIADDIFGQFSAPIIGAGSALISNYDNFTKRPIYNESDPVAYQAAAIANYTYDLMAPPFLSSHGVVSPMGLVDQKFGGKMVQALSGTTNRFGDPKATEGQAIGALIGANFYGMDPEHTRITNLQVMNRKILDAERQLKTRLMDRGLSQEQRAAFIADYQTRMQELATEMQEYAKESEVPEQLRVRK